MNKQHPSNILERLKTIPLFNEFRQPELLALLQHSKVLKFPAGAQIIKEGNFDNRLYVLLEGSVSVIKDGIEVNKLLAPGEIFGEMCIIDGAPRSADVNTLEATTCLVTDMSFLDKSDQTFTSMFYRLMAEVLSCRLRKSDQNICFLAKTAKGGAA